MDACQPSDLGLPRELILEYGVFMQRLWVSLVFVLSLLAADSAIAQGWKGGMTIRSAGNVGVGVGALACDMCVRR